jgi:hypothetical protein
VGSGRDGPCSEGHAAVGDGGSVFDDQHPPAAEFGPGPEGDRRCGPDDGRARIDGGEGREQRAHLVRRRGIDLVDEEHVRHPQAGLAGVVAELVSRAQRIGHDDEEVRGHEREVVVAPVPDDDVGLGGCPLEDVGVVDAGVHHHAELDGSLVLLALLDGGVGASISATVLKRCTLIRSRSP